jgi:hypothetical protein
LTFIDHFDRFFTLRQRRSSPCTDPFDLQNVEEGKNVIAKSKKKLTGHILADDKTFDVVRRTAKIAGMK